MSHPSAAAPARPAAPPTGPEASAFRLRARAPGESRSRAPGASPHRPPDFHLLRWFAVLSLLCVAISAGGTAIFLGRFLTAHMLERDAAVSAEFLDSIVRAERTWSWFRDPASAAAREPLESFFNHVSKLPGVVRANVFAADGTVLWSSDPAMIGRRFDDNHELQEALRGEVAVETGTVPKAEHIGLDSAAPGRRFTEAYLPVHDEARGSVVGVVEIYRLPDALFAAIDEGVRLIWTAAGLSAALLWAVLLGIAIRARCVIAQQQLRLVETETLAAIGAVASAVAHGIRNPLASIRSSAELAAVEDGPGARECLGDILREADRVEGWVRDLLLQARGEVVAAGEVDVNLLLADSARSFEAVAARQGVALTLAPGALPRVQAEPAAIGQAIDNLISNAIEAMPAGGRLRIATALLPAQRQVEIRIEDTGEGLPRAAAAGGLFFSTRPRGTGLGLLLTRRIAERHGGALLLANRPGGGTVASIRLPLADSVPAAATASPRLQAGAA